MLGVLARRRCRGRPRAWSWRSAWRAGDGSVAGERPGVILGPLAGRAVAAGALVLVDLRQPSAATAAPDRRTVAASQASTAQAGRRSGRSERPGVRHRWAYHLRSHCIAKVAVWHGRAGPSPTGDPGSPRSRRWRKAVTDRTDGHPPWIGQTNFVPDRRPDASHPPGRSWDGLGPGRGCGPVVPSESLSNKAGRLTRRT